MYNNIICISLKRRTDRRKAIAEQIKNLSLDESTKFSFLDACDWMNLKQGLPSRYRLYPNWQNLHSNNPWWNRPLKLGEIACGISHIMAWEVAAQVEGNTLILEDDAVFSKDYNQQIEAIKKEAINLHLDFFYLGRNDLHKNWKMISDSICIPSYSYRTHAYIISSSLAKNLCQSPYLHNLIPVDEYLPTLYCEHPRQDIRELFSIKLTTVFAAQPNLVFQLEDIDKNTSNSDIETSPNFCSDYDNNIL